MHEADNETFERKPGVIHAIDLLTGETMEFDYYACIGRGLPDGWTMLDTMTTSDWVTAYRRALQRDR